ncbi:MAG: hypothetical protein ACRBCS_08305 [Cellvibrionaceae bacterium]
MNTAVLSQTQAHTHSPQDATIKNYHIKGQLLLSLYLIIPLCFLVALIDYMYLGNQLRDKWLPTNPTSLVLWAILFNFPHIVSSVVTLADKEYLHFYKRKFIFGLIVIVSLVLSVDFIAPLVFPKATARNIYSAFFVFFSVYTMYHVLSQQLGIGMMLMKLPRTKQFESLRILSTIAGTLMYLNIFGGRLLNNLNVGNITGYGLIQVLGGVFVILAIIQGLLVTRGSKSRTGTWYIYSNLIMLLAVYAFLWLDYYIFVIAIPRFVHDITAFIIYSVHDQNRNAVVKHNFIYRWLSFLPIAPIVLCSILAVLLANTIECGTYMLDVSLGFYAKGSSECFIRNFYSPQPTTDLPFTMRIGLQISLIVALFHYYIEGFVWKRESIHRHSVAFT